MVLYLANFLCIQLAAAGVFLFYRLGSPRKASKAGLSAYILQFVPYLVVSGIIAWFLMTTLARLAVESGEDLAVRTTIESIPLPPESEVDPIISREANEVVITFRGPEPPPAAYMSALRDGIEERVAHPIRLRVKWIQSQEFELGEVRREE